ncbi:pre-16S rRNA-processing nuclease YqgF [Pleurocapsa sp. PCC 7319]|uniref:pre-16S rRNA-processing nuclease YqgF n=1 Tax=Pleurocapsa sp. PCC 7319 TaxID=118161 RepID=UPI00034BE7B5|nr:pre-16S rRNA-processing nuclease YqgF [Pleurocapsa sp. PCC 7319]
MEDSIFSESTILGLDPGRDKCGVAVIDSDNQVVYQQVIDSTEAIAVMKQLWQQFNVHLIVMGDGTTSDSWRKQIEADVSTELAIVTVDETNSTLEARDRYWQMYPPRGWQYFIPKGLRVPPRPVDDIVAILLIERYKNTQRNSTSAI